MTQKIPDGFSTITPSLLINGAAEAIELYKKALGATEISRINWPDGSDKIMHACLQIGSSKIFLADAVEGINCGAPSNSNFYLYLDDVDAAFAKARAAGLDETCPVTDMFWGDRMGAVKDKFGIGWTLATHTRDVSPEEMEAAKKQFGKAA